MFNEAFWIERSRAVWTLFKSFVVIIKRLIVIFVDRVRVLLSNCEHFVEILGRFWAGFPLVTGFLLLFDFPHLFASLQVNLQAGRAVLAPTDVAYKSLGSFGRTLGSLGGLIDPYFALELFDV